MTSANVVISINTTHCYLPTPDGDFTMLADANTNIEYWPIVIMMAGRHHKGCDKAGRCLYTDGLLLVRLCAVRL